MAKAASLIVLVFAAMFYVVLRAANVSFTWDESWTFIHHVLPGTLFPSQHDLMSGNHHLLNVWGMWLASRSLGESELALRLPNVVAFVLYAMAAVRLALRAERTVPVLLCVVLLIAHPYLLEFFGLARGYGLAIGFMLMSVWHLVQWCDRQEERRQSALMFLFAGLSVLAHFTMINFFVALAAVFVGRLLGKRHHTTIERWRDVCWPLIVGAVVFAISAPQIIGTIKAGGVIWGCDEFWSCCLSGLLLRLAGTDLNAALVGPLTIVAAVFLLEAALHQWEGRHRATAMLATITLLCAGLIAVEHMVFGMEWPRTRTALYFVPLLAVVLVLWLQASTSQPPWLWAPALMCAGVLLVNTVWRANLSHTSEWPEAADVGQMVQLVKTHRAEGAPLGRTRLSSGPVAWGSLGYYFHRLNITEIDTIRCWPDKRHQASEYYLVEPHGQPFDSNGTELMFRSGTGVRLYRSAR